MEPITESATAADSLPAKPICIGLTCWLWEWRRREAILQLARRLDVTVHMKQQIHGLHREIVAEVSGRNVDRFLGEFARNC